MEKGGRGGGRGAVSGLVGRAERAAGGNPGGLPAGGVRGMSTWAKQQNNEEPRAVNKEVVASTP